MNSEFFSQYDQLLSSLDEIVSESEARVISRESDELFVSNVNFFVKSYLINTCAYLEAYLQDIAFLYVSEIQNKLQKAKIPHNFIYWQTSKTVKLNELKFQDANFSVSKKKLSDEISPSPYKTLKLFRLIGIDLEQIEDFRDKKELINTAVNKRNKIIHHNDDANDLSFSDISSYILEIKNYIRAIDLYVCSAISEFNDT